MSNGKDSHLTFAQDKRGKQVEDLYHFLYNDLQQPDIFRKSRKNLTDFVQIYNRDTFISFIGAGVSKVLGIADWNKLIENLYEKARDNNFRGNYVQDPNNWPQLAEDIYKYFDQISKRKIYFDTIRKNMIAKNNTTTLTLVKLILACNSHLTTNFDRSIENAYEFLNYLSRYFDIVEIKKNYESYCLGNLKFSQNQSLGLIFYLHGNKEKNVYILRKSDYEKFYPSVSNSTINSSHQLESFLEERYRNNNIVFIGFSFDDPYVKRYFFELSKKVDAENPLHARFYDESGASYQPAKVKHFLIVDASILRKYSSDVHELFVQHSIYPIIYSSEDHVFVEELLETLSEGQRQW